MAMTDEQRKARNIRENERKRLAAAKKREEKARKAAIVAAAQKVRTDAKAAEREQAIRHCIGRHHLAATSKYEGLAIYTHALRAYLDVSLDRMYSEYANFMRLNYKTDRPVTRAFVVGFLKADMAEYVDRAVLKMEENLPAISMPEQEEQFTQMCKAAMEGLKDKRMREIYCHEIRKLHVTSD
ncbi:hypothetical protein KIPB_011752 [Kipferlia bialata]|uniref:Uncharacterized protein n=1 Tax=Kipferlia bialata TaxID=797122 RepID=A0A391NUU5_9EUKA|nr:hypothetical protein KIPB_011752 [Kipferlia bialata]|eukprot:g11752.t1